MLGVAICTELPFSITRDELLFSWGSRVPLAVVINRCVSRYVDPCPLPFLGLEVEKDISRAASESALPASQFCQTWGLYCVDLPELDRQGRFCLIGVIFDSRKVVWVKVALFSRGGGANSCSIFGALSTTSQRAQEQKPSPQRSLQAWPQAWVRVHGSLQTITECGNLDQSVSNVSLRFGEYTDDICMDICAHKEAILHRSFYIHLLHCPSHLGPRLPFLSCGSCI